MSLNSISPSFDINNTSLQGLEAHLKSSKLPNTASFGKSYAESCPPSSIQGRVSDLKGLRHVGLAVLSGAGFGVGMFFTIMAVGIYFTSNPAIKASVFLGAGWGVSGSTILIGIAISSVAHWKLKKKLSTEELRILFEEEQKAIDAHSDKLNKSEAQIQNEREMIEKRNESVRTLQQMLPPSGK